MPTDHLHVTFRQLGFDPSEGFQPSGLSRRWSCPPFLASSSPTSMCFFILRLVRELPSLFLTPLPANLKCLKCNKIIKVTFSYQSSFDPQCRVTGSCGGRGMVGFPGSRDRKARRHQRLGEYSREHGHKMASLSCWWWGGLAAEKSQ